MHARCYVLIALAYALGGGAVHSQTVPLRLAGIVEVPAVFNRYRADGTPIPPEKSVEIRTRPAVNSPVAATIAEPGQLESQEYGYEESGAVVYARDRSWSLVRTDSGVVGWLSPQDAGEYHTLEALLAHHHELAHLTDAWDGAIAAAPGGATRRRVPIEPSRRVVGYLEPATEDTTLHPVFDRPDPGGQPVAHVATANPERALKITGSVPYQIVVRDRKAGWFQVALAEETEGEVKPAWVQASPIWRFHGATNEAQQREFATGAWGPDNPNVRALGTRRIGDVLWVEIEVLNHSFCVGQTPVVRERGWIPAHATSGAVNIWYPSRGC
jgi:hypothetical protein